jgi:hypothetical protein
MLEVFTISQWSIVLVEQPHDNIAIPTELALARFSLDCFVGPLIG